MKKEYYFLYLLILMILSSCDTMKKKADLVIFNAKVYTVDENFSTAECVVVSDGVIIDIGSSDIARKYEADRLLDVSGMFVYPGFYDAHCHFLAYGEGKLRQADFSGTASFEEVVGRVKDHALANSSEWVLGRGWDQNDWPVKEFPDNKALDEIFPDRPVLLIRVDGHAALANSEAMRRAGINAGTKVKGGEVILEQGKPSGVLIDNAIELVRAVIPPQGEELKISGLKVAQADCFAVGLTSVMDAGLDVADIMLIDSLQKQGVIKMKVNAMLASTDTAYLDFMKQGTYKTGKLHVNSIKLYADGALGSRGACLIHEYSDDPGNHGLIIHDDAYYRDVMVNAYKYLYQVNTHAIGDSGNRYMLDLYASFLGGRNDRRWRIEHAQIVAPEDFRKFSEHNIIPSVQATHATSDMYWAGDRVGEERLKGAYAYRSLLATNGWLPNGTDFPIEQINPLYTFYASVARKDLQGYPEGGYLPEESLSREEALRSMTIWAAKGAFEEHEKGSLEIGKAADIVVLDTDLMAEHESELPRAGVAFTIVDGEVVFSR